MRPRLKLYSMVVVAEGFGSSFLPNKPRKPLRFRFLWLLFGALASYHRQFVGHLVTESLLTPVYFCKLEQFLLLVLKKNTEAVYVGCLRNEDPAELTQCAVDMESLAMYLSRSMSVHSIAVSPISESAVMCMLSSFISRRSSLAERFLSSIRDKVCSSL